MTAKGFIRSLYRRGVPVMLVGILTGLTVGVTATFFVIAADILAESSFDIYLSIRQHPQFIPLLFLVLAIGAFMIATLTHLLPMLASNGVPQTEGVSRGILKLKWYQMLPAMAAAGLASIFMGLSAGAEGPSMFIGGMCGDGVSRLFKCTDMERRYQITGGACAGVAVAAGAPLTGIVFALEEAHRRFTPSILICTFSSVVTATATRNLLFRALGMAVSASFTGFELVHMPPIGYLYVALAALVTGLIGVAFSELVKLSRKLFSRVTALKGFVRYLIPFLFAGAIGMICVYSTGGGHSLINMLGTNGGEGEISVQSIFSSPLAVTLLVILLLRFFALVLNIGAGVPAGIFVPILALGGLVGSLMTQLFALMGMDAALADSIVLICMSAMLAATVKAPLTAIIFVVEFTWRSTLLLPVVLGSFIGFILSEIFREKPLYDLLLEDMVEHTMPKHLHHEYITTIEDGSSAAGQSIRDVLWQEGVLIRSVERDGEQLIPTSDTVLLAGDKLTLHADVIDSEDFEKRIEEIVKPQKHLPELHLPHHRHPATTPDALSESPDAPCNDSPATDSPATSSAPRNDDTSATDSPCNAPDSAPSDK